MEREGSAEAMRVVWQRTAVAQSVLAVPVRVRESHARV